MFSRIDTDEALIVENGVYRPVDVYRGPDGGLYVKAKGGFVRVKERGDTSHPTVKITLLMREGPLYRDAWGRLCVTEADGRRPVSLPRHPEGAIALTITQN